MTEPENANGVTVSGYLLERLKERGVRHVFAVPGDYFATFLNELDSDETQGIVRTATVNELEAGFAADGYARVKGLSCVAVQFGVGAYSLLNAVAGAARERVPMVVVTGAPGAPARRSWLPYGIVFHHSTTASMETERRIFAEVVAATEVIADAEGAAAAIDRALATAIEQSAPVYIQIWADVQGARIDRPSAPLAVRPPAASPPDALAAATDAAFGRLAAARSPVIWAGLEIQRFRLSDRLVALAEASGAPVATTLQAKGALPGGCSFNIGAYAGGASDAALSARMQAADLILELGVVPIDYYKGLVIDKYADTVAATDAGVRVGYAEYAGVGIGEFLDALIAKVSASDRFPRREAPTAKTVMRLDDPMAAITCESLFRRIQATLDPSAVVCCEVSVGMFLAAGLEIARADGFIAQADWASLGFAAPCALGVALAEDRPVLAICGDGGFQMTAQTLSTYAREKPKATIIVMDNGVYAIEQAFTNLKAYVFDPKKNGYAADFDKYNIVSRWRYADLAEALGLEAAKVGTIRELDAALARAAATPGPFLIQVTLGERDLPPAIADLVRSFQPKAG